MDTIKFSEIIEKFENSKYENRRKSFIKLFKSFLSQKYENKRFLYNQSLFIDEYLNQEILANRVFERDYSIERDSIQKKIERITNNSEVNIMCSSNTSTSSISRELIIRIVFVLVSPKNDGAFTEYVNLNNETLKNNVDVLNELLNAIGYYKFPAPSLLEMFYAYAFKNNLSLETIHEKYRDYLKEKNNLTKLSINKKEKIDSKTTIDNSTTFYVNLAENASDNNLFDVMYEIEMGLNNHSKSTSSLFKKSWNRQIENLEKENQNLSDSKRNKNEEMSDNIWAGVDFYTSICSKSPCFFKNREEYLQWYNENTSEYDKFESTNVKLSIENGYYVSIIRGNKKAANKFDIEYEEFKKRNPDKNISKKEYINIEYEKFKKLNSTKNISKEVYIEWSIYRDKINEIDIVRYNDLFQKYKTEHFKMQSDSKYVVPLSSYIGWKIYLEHNLESGIDVYDYINYYEQKESLRYETLRENITKICNNQKVVTREGFLLWLLYCNESFDSEKLSSIVLPRYEGLNPKVYFDNFVILVSSFKLSSDNKIVYKDFESKMEYEVTISDKDEIYTDNPHILRKSIITTFAKKYSSEMGIKFVGNTNFSVKKIKINKAKKKQTSK